MQYLSEKELLQICPIRNIGTDDLISTDTYDETLLLQKLSKLDQMDRILLCKAAFQISIIGAGGKTYGAIKHNDKIIELEDIFKKHNILIYSGQDTTMGKDTLTPRRLCRLFRYQIRQFIVKTQRPSYLWLKYAPKENLQFKDICFPGSEHLIETVEEAKFLLETYKILDAQFKTSFTTRLNRVFMARGIQI